jgi:hypothetical protein
VSKLEDLRIICLACPAVMTIEYVEHDYKVSHVLLVLTCHGETGAFMLDEERWARFQHSRTPTSADMQAWSNEAVEQRLADNEKVMLEAAKRVEALQRVVKVLRADKAPT